MPKPLASGDPPTAWRLDPAAHASTWDSGIGAELMGGRWNPKGTKAGYCSFDPSTTILESAVHRGFTVLDTQRFMLTRMMILDAAAARVVHPADIPNPAWLHAGIPSAGQQAWGARLLDAHAFVIIPSVVSRFSWNLVFRPDRAAGKYAPAGQEQLVIDTRLNPPSAPR